MVAAKCRKNWASNLEALDESIIPFKLIFRARNRSKLELAFSLPYYIIASLVDDPELEP